jgi:hypothetical protein
VILLIAHQAPANTAENESRYFLGGMTEEEALALFTQRLQDETGSLECDEETMKELAEQLDHIPGSIVDATRDINVKLISPADYLEGLKARGSAHEGTGRILGLETIYEALPAGGRAVLPYLGILRNVPWTADDLFAISPETNRTIEVGLVQLERAGLIDRLDAGTYRTPVAIGQFALSKLNEQGGQALVRAAMTLRTADIMRKVELILRFARQSLLGQCFTDDSTHEAIKQSIFNQFSKNERSGSGVAEESSLIAMHLDPLQEFFEDYVLTHHPYVQLWADMLDGFNIAMIRRQLEEVFDWAMEQEDWPLVQRFAYRVGVNSSWMLDTKLNGKLNERNWARFGFNFALLKKIRGTNAEMQGVCLKGSQLKYTVWNNCQFIGMEWPGAHVDSSTFSNVDMVGMVLPAGVVTGCTFKNVDARYGDFRGTIFQQCVFDNVNVRAAQLENAKFIDCYFGENVDLRLTVVEDAFAGRNSPTR